MRGLPSITNYDSSDNVDTPDTDKRDSNTDRANRRSSGAGRLVE
jgi:hypothetical protein